MKMIVDVKAGTFEWSEEKGLRNPAFINFAKTHFQPNKREMGATRTNQISAEKVVQQHKEILSEIFCTRIPM